MKKILGFILIMLLTDYLHAILYEDAEDSNTDTWFIYDGSPSGASISNVVDNGNRVIQLKGQGTDNGFILGNWENRTNAWNNTEDKILSWKMKLTGDFKVFIRVNTTRQPKYLYYDNNPSDTINHLYYVHHSLGTSANNGTWQTFTRNLEDDLKDAYPDYSITSINAFLIRGSALIDDIRLDSSTYIEEDTTPPTLVLNGSDHLSIKQYSVYEELSATATDNRDGSLEVTTSGTVNTEIVGDYTITYTAQDSSGNTGSISRTVSVTEASSTETIYEDGENESSLNWSIYDSSPSGASVSNIIDNNNHVIQLKGQGMDNGFILGDWENRTNAWNNTQDKTLSWKMKLSEDFKIFIRVDTTHQSKFLYYDSNLEDTINRPYYIHHSLGTSANNGTWQTFTRNLEDDLKDIYPDDSITAVNAFLVRGSALIDDITMGVSNNEGEYNIAPRISMENDKEAVINKSIAIIATATDSDGSIVAYEWKKGDTVLATTSTFDYTPTVIGTDTLTLTVTDNNGATATKSINITVTPILDSSNIVIGARSVASTPLDKGNIFIAPEGSGRACTKEAPCAFEDLVRHYLSVKADDIVFFREGIYSLNNLEKWNPVGRVTYESYPGEMAIIDGGNFWTYIKDSHVVFRKMTFQNSQAYGIQIQSSYNKIEGCIIKNNLFSGIDISNDSKISNNPNINSFNILIDNIVHDNSDEFRVGSYGNEADGIVTHYGEGNIVRNNTIYNNSDDGIDGFASLDTMISYNLVYSNGRGVGGNGNGIKLTSSEGAQGTGNNQIAHHNIVYNNKTNGITSQTTGNAIIIYNTAYNNAFQNDIANNYTTNKFTNIEMNIADSDFLLSQYRGSGPDNQANNPTSPEVKNTCSGYVNSTEPLMADFLRPLNNSNCENRGAYYID